MIFKLDIRTENSDVNEYIKNIMKKIVMLISLYHRFNMTTNSIAFSIFQKITRLNRLPYSILTAYNLFIFMTQMLLNSLQKNILVNTVD